MIPYRQPFVVAGCPVRSRSWAIPRHIAALMAQERRPDALCYLVNDDGPPDPETGLDTLGAFQYCVPTICESQYAPDDVAQRPNTGVPYIQRIHVELYNTAIAGTGNTQRVADDRGPRYDIANLAAVRNRWLAVVRREFPEATHVWSCDSDVCPDPNVLQLLLDESAPIISAVVRNNSGDDEVPGAYNFWCGWDEIKYEPRRQGSEMYAVHYGQKDLAVAIRVTMTGACVLMRRDVIERLDPETREPIARVEYSPHPNGEDIAFSIAAARAGFSLYTHLGARTNHIQPDGSVWR